MRLRSENEELRTELTRRRALPRVRSLEAVKFTGSFIIPMFDRQRVFRTFVAFFNEASFYTLPQENWPDRERVLDKGRDFGLAILRFFVKRRLIIFVFSLLALAMPLVQVWLVFQQNEIIQNQNKYFNIQVYDIVARSMTDGDPTSRQITSALLAREDFTLVNGIILAVFESEAAGAFTEQAVTGVQPRVLKETAARGHLVSALGQAVAKQREEKSDRDVWDSVEETYRVVVNDATSRVPSVLRVDRATADLNPAVTTECYLYLYSLSTFLRKAYRVAQRAGEEEPYFAALGPLVDRLSHLRLRNPDDLPFRKVLGLAFEELLVDFARPSGEAPEIGDEEVPAAIRKGFRILVERSNTGGRSVNEAQLKQLLEVL